MIRACHEYPLAAQLAAAAPSSGKGNEILLTKVEVMQQVTDVGTLRTNTQNWIPMSLDYSVREEILYGCLSWLVDIKIASLVWMFWQVETQGDRRLMHILVGLDRIQVLGVLTSKKHHRKRCFPQTQNNHLYSDEESHLHSTSLSFLIVPLLSRGAPETLEPHRAFAYGGISHCLCRAITSIRTPRITASQVNFDIHLTLAYISQHDLLPLNCINRSLGTLLFQASVQSFYAPPFFPATEFK